MKEYSIDCSGASNAAELHNLLANHLELSGHRGYDLDALYECLTAISHETHITLFGLEELDFSEDLRTTLQNAESDNFWLSISIQ